MYSKLSVFVSSGPPAPLPHSPESGCHHVRIHVPFTPTYCWPAALSPLPPPHLKCEPRLCHWCVSAGEVCCRKWKDFSKQRQHEACEEERFIYQRIKDNRPLSLKILPCFFWCDAVHIMCGDVAFLFCPSVQWELLPEHIWWQTRQKRGEDLDEDVQMSVSLVIDAVAWLKWPFLWALSHCTHYYH